MKKQVDWDAWYPVYDLVDYVDDYGLYPELEFTPEEIVRIEKASVEFNEIQAMIAEKMRTAGFMNPSGHPMYPAEIKESQDGTRQSLATLGATMATLKHGAVSHQPGSRYSPRPATD